MQERKARDLQVGDVFCRLSHAGASPTAESTYTVRAMQWVPIRDFFGGTCDTIHVTADNRLLGPQRVQLGADEPIYLMDAGDPRAAAAPVPPGPPARSRGLGRRTTARLRRRG